MRIAVWGLLIAIAMPGCLMVQVGVTNPIPELSTVAVVPFFNQSVEPSQVVDGRRFAIAYATELQKVPGYQVLPVGVTETAIVRNGLDLSNPRDVLQLAEILGVDAVVVGAVTHYDPYYPPRIGLQVDWYSPREWTFRPGVPVVPIEEEGLLSRWKHRLFDDAPEACGDECIVRSQSADTDDVRPLRKVELPERTAADGNDQSESADPFLEPKSKVIFESPVGFWQRHEDHRPVVSAETRIDFIPDVAEIEASPGSSVIPAQAGIQQSARRLPMRTPSADPLDSRLRGNEAPSAAGSINPRRLLTGASGNSPSPFTHGASSTPQPRRLAGPGIVAGGYPSSAAFDAKPFDPTQPLMSYTRFFDGADSDLQATLRDYFEFLGDHRSGGWEAYLHRSDDFIRFTSHLMIVEMLTLHGGEAEHRFVLKGRKSP